MLMVFNRNCCQYVCKKLTPTIEHGLNLHISIVIAKLIFVVNHLLNNQEFYAHKFYALVNYNCCLSVQKIGTAQNIKYI